MGVLPDSVFDDILDVVMKNINDTSIRRYGFGALYEFVTLNAKSKKNIPKTLLEIMRFSTTDMTWLSRRIEDVVIVMEIYKGDAFICEYGCGILKVITVNSILPVKAN